MIAIASDHGGYDLKERVKKYLEENNIPFQDFGCDSKASCDYPVFGHAAAKAVAAGTCEKGIVICTTGIGISISANKVKGIRCALCSEPLSAKMTRLHNDANMLAMGAGIVGENLALEIVETFLNTPFYLYNPGRTRKCTDYLQRGHRLCSGRCRKSRCRKSPRRNTRPCIRRRCRSTEKGSRSCFSRPCHRSGC